jgi:[acyl-carrier-protein] S-malonyltransferase
MRAFLFPGQGSQYIGMAGRVPDPSSTRTLFGQASDVLGIDLWQLVEAGEEETLVRTENTQPALFVTEVAWVRALARRGVLCDVAAGHSLGEFTALCAAGVFTFEDGVRLVRRRGEIMAKAASDSPGTMAALIGLGQEELELVLAEGQAVGVVEAANYNAVRALGRGRAIRLRVGAPFHSSIMAQGSIEFRVALRNVSFANPRFPVVNNVAGSTASDPDAIRENLVSQFRSPVQWIWTMETLQQMGADQYLEIGPKNVLAALARKAIPAGDIKAAEGESWT